MGTRAPLLGILMSDRICFSLKSVSMIDIVVNFIVELNYKESDDSNFAADYTI
jgi:hypothetical protein